MELILYQTVFLLCVIIIAQEVFNIPLKKQQNMRVR